MRRLASPGQRRAGRSHAHRAQDQEVPTLSLGPSKLEPRHWRRWSRSCRRHKRSCLTARLPYYHVGATRGTKSIYGRVGWGRGWAGIAFEDYKRAVFQRDPTSTSAPSPPHSTTRLNPARPRARRRGRPPQVGRQGDCSPHRLERQEAGALLPPSRPWVVVRSSTRRRCTALLQAADYEDVHHVLLDATELKRWCRWCRRSSLICSG